jgi:hypothetical protein
MSDTTPRPVKCADCGWTGNDENIKVLYDCDGLGERLDPGCTVPAGECVECGAFVYFTDQKSRTDWRDLADDAIRALEALRDGEASDGDWRSVDDIIQTHEEWKGTEGTTRWSLRLRERKNAMLRQKIEAVFDKLTREGWFAKSDWQCCQSCGWAAIPKAFCGPIAFFHEQDAEQLDIVNSNPSCCIAFGHSDETPESTIAAGERLVAALKAEGCFVKWDGTENERPTVMMHSS